MNNIIIFPEGTTKINSLQSKVAISTIIIPHSVEMIEERAFYGLGCNVYYVGTRNEFSKIINNNSIGVPCVECVDGLLILQI